MGLENETLGPGRKTIIENMHLQIYTTPCEPAPTLATSSQPLQRELCPICQPDTAADRLLILSSKLQSAWRLEDRPSLGASKLLWKHAWIQIYIILFFWPWRDLPLLCPACHLSHGGCHSSETSNDTGIRRKRHSDLKGDIFVEFDEGVDINNSIFFFVMAPFPTRIAREK